MLKNKVANNIINKYGYNKFAMLIQGFLNNRNNVELGKIFNVSRQRVLKWKQALGTTYIVFELDHDIQQFIKEKK